MNRYFNQLDQKNTPINVYQLVLNEIEPPLINAVMKFSNNNQSKAARILGLNRTTLRTKLKKYNILRIGKFSWHPRHCRYKKVSMSNIRKLS